ncbi:MAG: hypothetical protein RL385_1814 [Pseudomonadota bacterium]|jgi:hypothetical protein
MERRSVARHSVPLAIMLGTSACADASLDEAQSSADEALVQARQDYVDSINGLKTINGLKSINGLKTINGLSTTNGLATINGLKTMNGLATKNGLKTINGLSVDCAGRTLGTTCTGSPDGLFSASTGLLSNDDAIVTAKYLVRCALPAGASLRVKDYTGALVTLSGEIGVAAEWKEAACSTACEEKVTACLMALTNGKGEHVPLELSAPFTPLGTATSGRFPYQEAAFYGNVFVDPPQAFYCIGDDYALVSSKSIEHLAVRACDGYNDKFGLCPYKQTGLCNSAASSTYEGVYMDYMCYDTGDTLRKCRDVDGGARKWLYPITTHRDVR